MSPPVVASPPVIASPIAASPPVLRQVAAALRTTAADVAGDLTGTYHLAAPDHSANPDWAVTAALAELIMALDSALSHAAGRAQDTADRLEQAAGEYEQADERAAGRLRW